MGEKPQIPSREEVAADRNVLHQRAPARPVGDKAVEVTVVGRRCVYINDHRVAGSKPYVSENLPSFDLTCSLNSVLDAFSEDDVLTAIRERKARKDYFASFHAQPKLEPATAS